MSFQFEQDLSDAITDEDLKKILDAHFNLGQFIHAKRNNRGYINTSFEVNTLQKGRPGRYMVRLYRKGTPEEKIRFEHALLNALLQKKFRFSPHLLETKDGETYVKVYENPDNQGQEYHLAVFSYLDGEDKYTWDDPMCTDEELQHAAEVFALYHNAIFGWNYPADLCLQRIIDRLPSMTGQWQEHAQQRVRSSFQIFFSEQLEDLLMLLKGLLKAPGKDLYNKMPHLAAHRDFHPGNLKFQDGKVTGLFDFDWSLMDARSFDVGLSLMYFCTAWEGDADGNLMLDRVSGFLEAYQKTAKGSMGIGPLNTFELRSLLEMIHLGNVFILDWAVGDYYNLHTDPDEYKTYFRHGVRLFRWVEQHRDLLEKTIMNHR